MPGLEGSGGWYLVEPRVGAEHLPCCVDVVQGIAVSARLHQQRDQGCAEVGIVGPMVNRAVKRCRELLAATALPQEFAERGMGLHPCRIRRADLVERREPAVDLSGLAPGDRFAQRDRKSTRLNSSH